MTIIVALIDHNEWAFIGKCLVASKEIHHKYATDTQIQHTINTRTCIISILISKINTQDYQTDQKYRERIRNTKILMKESQKVIRY